MEAHPLSGFLMENYDSVPISVNSRFIFNVSYNERKRLHNAYLHEFNRYLSLMNSIRSVHVVSLSYILRLKLEFFSIRRERFAYSLNYGYELLIHNSCYVGCFGVINSIHNFHVFCCAGPPTIVLGQLVSLG